MGGTNAQSSTGKVSLLGHRAYPNLTVKKIPKQVLSRCEWGHDDYSLQVENLPKAPPKPAQMDLI
jgi:adenine-specific DNA-methyltransferase